MAIVLLLGCICAPAWASEATQCANMKGDSDPETCDAWVTGNLNKAKAGYLEGEAIPYRLVVKPAVPGHEYEVTIGWDAVESAKNALDYLTAYNHSVAAADPCRGGLCVFGSPSDSAPIPQDALLALGRNGIDEGGSGDDVHQASGDFVLWGGTFVSIGSYNYPAAFSYSGTHEITLTLRFRANAGVDTVVLGWGGHIASRLDWGRENGVVNLQGSPYHMRASALEYDGGGNLVGSVSGVQGDLVLATAAVVFPSYMTVTKETDRPTARQFDFETNGDAADVEPGSSGVENFALRKGDSIVLTFQGNSDGWVGELLDTGDLWELDSVTCRDSDNTSLAYDRTGNRIELTLGEFLNANCLFRNVFTGLPNLEIDKRVLPDGGECSPLVFEGSAHETLSIASGDAVRYCYRIRNTGNDIAYNLSLLDDAGTPDDMTDDFYVTLGGGDLAALGSPPDVPDSMVDDLDVGGTTYGSSKRTIGLAVDSKVINLATVSGLDYFGQPISASDTAEVTVDRRQACTLTGGVSTDGNCASATAVVNVIAGTSLTWCADVCMQSGNSDLLSATIASTETATGNVIEAVSGATIKAGACDGWNFQEIADGSGHLRTLVADGSDAYGNAIGCEDDIAANVFNPDIGLEKQVSLDRNCTNAKDSLTVYYGTDVWYCFSVANTGDEDLHAVTLTDENLFSNNAIAVGGDATLAKGSRPWEYTSEPYRVTHDLLNTATVTGYGDMTGAKVMSRNSADVHMLFADLKVEKGGTDRIDAREPGPKDIDYWIKVTNIGNTTARDVVVTDTLPDLFVYGSDESACVYDGTAHTLTCSVGDIASGESIEILVHGMLVEPSPIFGVLENLACAKTIEDTRDVNPDNNCDTHKTRIVPGPTRTIGFWQNHPGVMAECLAHEDNTVILEHGTCGSGVPEQYQGIDLGYVEIADEVCDDDIDATVSTGFVGNGNGQAKNLKIPVRQGDLDPDVETGLELALGVLKASPSHWSDGTRRSPLDQARTQAGRQVLAAVCNTTLLGALWPGFLDDYIAILQGDDINAILELGRTADEYNNSGDQETIGEHDSAVPDANSDDPTDPTE